MTNMRIRGHVTPNEALEVSPRCCSPNRDSLTVEPQQEQLLPTASLLESHAPSAGMVILAGGRFEMGGEDVPDALLDGELPVHQVELRPFAIDACAISNREFARFVAATSYVTDAERCGWSFVFQLLLPADFPPTRGVLAAPWWRVVEGASWWRPEGPQSDVGARLDHPVVHVSWNDAAAYARWAGKRLPTEAEWEYAARGGLARTRFPWGDALNPDGRHRCNVWQGQFPALNTCEDGYLSTAPVQAFEPNGYGLYNMVGNVWEWCADWFDPGYYRVSPMQDPRGPTHGEARVVRGGSYLCHASYCSRYRVGARSRSTPDSSSGNTGFRCAADVPRDPLRTTLDLPGAPQ